MLVVPLDAARHDRARFSCGVPSLDAYLKTQASQDVRRKANAVFVLAQEAKPNVVLGYFTLRACRLAPGLVPDEVRKRLPRYPKVSATLIGRLAVALSHRDQGLGGALLVRALRKAYDSADVVGSSMVVVDAFDESAAHFYIAHGFVRLPESSRLLLPMQTSARCLRLGRPPPHKQISWGKKRSQKLAPVLGAHYETAHAAG